jgi:hypothetical protein
MQQDIDKAIVLLLDPFLQRGSQGTPGGARIAEQRSDLGQSFRGWLSIVTERNLGEPQKSAAQRDKQTACTERQPLPVTGSR